MKRPAIGIHSLNWKKCDILTVLIIALLVLHFASLSLSGADLIYDEVSHISIARSIVEGRGYGYVGFPGSDAFRPPLVPVLYAGVFSVFGAGYFVARIVSAIFLVLGVLVVWLLGKRLFSKGIADYAAVFTAAAPILWFFSTKAMVETPLVFLSGVFLYSFYRSQDKSLWLLLSVPALALLVLAKYTAGIFILFFAIWVLWRKREWLLSRYFYIGLALAFLILSPWLAVNMTIYRNPIGSALTHFSSSSGLAYTGIDFYYISFALPLLAGFFAPFTILGFYYLYRDRQKKHLAVFVLLIVLFVILLTLLEVKRVRYLLPLVPVLAMVTGYGFERIGKQKIAGMGLAVIVVMSLGATFYGMNNYPKHERFEALREAGFYLQNNCAGRDWIYSNVYPYVFWFTGKTSKNLEEVLPGISNTCILVDRFIYNNEGKYREIKDSYSLVFKSGKVEVYSAL